jgi:hypothetical protein
MSFSYLVPVGQTESGRSAALPLSLLTPPAVRLCPAIGQAAAHEGGLVHVEGVSVAFAFCRPCPERLSSF